MSVQNSLPYFMLIFIMLQRSITTHAPRVQGSVRTYCVCTYQGRIPSALRSLDR